MSKDQEASQTSMKPKEKVRANPKERTGKVSKEAIVRHKKQKERSRYAIEQVSLKESVSS